jgi:hypothetical protein
LSEIYVVENRQVLLFKNGNGNIQNSSGAEYARQIVVIYRKFETNATVDANYRCHYWPQTIKYWD